MDDFISERDQWEALKGWIKENGPWMVAGILVGVGVIYAYTWWQGREDKTGQTASARYSDVISALDRRDRARAIELTDQLHKDFAGTPYVDQSELALARLHVEAGELDDATKRLRRVMDESKDTELQEIARLRLARVQIAQQKPDEAIATLAAGKAAGGFEPRYAEVRGDALLAKGDKAGALAEYRKAQAATEPGLVDSGLLELKIKDLGAVEPAPLAETQPDASPAPAKPDASTAPAKPEESSGK